MKCYIMDDQYWKTLYENLSNKYKMWDFPIKDNITNPLDFLDDIKNNDLILLDNFFPWETREEPLWAEFLNCLLNKNINCKIICISDYWETLIDRFDEREMAYKNGNVIWFAPEKTALSVEKILW